MYKIFQKSHRENITELCLSYTNKNLSSRVNNKKAWRNSWDNDIETR